MKSAPPIFEHPPAAHPAATDQVSANQASAHRRISRLASLPLVHQAFRWLHLNEKRFCEWQLAIIRVPAPPFQEQARAAWILEEFTRIGLANPHIDAEGNVIGEIAPENPSPTASDQPCVLLSAHIDTIFPAGTCCEPAQEGARIFAPGACDNAAGVTALLALAASLLRCDLRPACTLLFAANVGEEGEGNLRGIRHIFERSPYRNRIAATVALDGAGTESVVAQALGSRRYSVTLNGPGGHSWADAGRPNPIMVLCRALATLGDVELPSNPRTTVNVGTIRGGNAVNSVPESASAQIDIRSTDAEQLVRTEVMLHRAVEDAVAAANSALPKVSKPARIPGHAPLSFTIGKIGERPAATLPPDARILQSIRAVDRHLRLRTEMRLGSTDANLPLSLGREAISIGAGGSGGGIHTSKEWYDRTGRELALRRILLLLLDLCDPASQSAFLSEEEPLLHSPGGHP